MSGYLQLILFLVALFGYAILCQEARKRKNSNRFWWTLNRWRSLIAVEGDPGPWSKRDST